MKKLLPFCVVLALFLIIYFSNYPHEASYQLVGFKCAQQPDDISCGPTSVFMLLQQYGIEASLDEIRQSTRTQQMGSTYPSYIASALKKYGVPSKVMRGNLDHLKYFINQVRPPIVLLRSSETTWHYAVVIGFTEDEIILADPAIGIPEVVKENNFLGAWDFTTNTDGKPMTGEIADVMVQLLRAAEIYSRTMIVPTPVVPAPEVF